MGSRSLTNKLTHDSPRAVRPRAHWLTILLDGYLVFAALVVVGMGALVHNSPYLPIDLSITRAVQSFNPPWFDLLMHDVNWLGFGLQSTGLISGIVLVTFLAGWRWESVVGAVDAATIWAINIVIGNIVARPYPQPSPDLNGMLVDLTKPSFPSGHASSFIAFYGFMFYLVYARATRTWLRIPLLIIFAALPLLVIPSRTYMGRHWPTDTVAAVALGTIWLIGAIYLYRWGTTSAWVRKHFANMKPVWQR